ncbi:chemotaxis protein CheW [Methanolobus sp. ZRKC2]|uniref:chemotaxis protein CheW n=1 Tax=unclassified Methanolobus TaxID=2629569 RepID=UPI0032505239
MSELTINDNSSTEELLQLVVCQLAEEEYGVKISSVKEIIRIPDITKIPQIPDYVEGVINLRNKIIPVISLAGKFNLPQSETNDQSRIVIVEIGNIVAGMIVDAVTEVLRIPVGNIESAPEIITSKISEKYIEGVGKIDERLLILLDIDHIFTEEQKMNISNLADAGSIPA